jgi:predicted PurR-regulated permease PerM
MVSHYVLQPRLMKKGLHATLLEIVLSLVIWGFLLGPWGGVLAGPLTLAVRKFVQGSSTKETLIRATPK